MNRIYRITDNKCFEFELENVVTREQDHYTALRMHIYIHYIRDNAVCGYVKIRMLNILIPK